MHYTVNFGKVTIFVVVLILCGVTSAFGQTGIPLPRIGVVDLQRIYQETNKNSAAMKQIEETTNRVNAEIRKRQDDIQLLEEKRLEAVNGDDARLVNDLNRQITMKKSELERYWNTANAQLTRMKEAVKVDADFMEMIQRTIADIANRNGYSVVLVKGAGLLYYSPKVDFSSDVINYINSTASQQ